MGRFERKNVRIYFAKLSEWRIPRSFVETWMTSLAKELKKQAGHSVNRKELTLAFVDRKRIKKLNQDFRSKPKVTDILSFSGFSEDELGELVLCGEVVDRQAREHGLSRREELGYLLIHGVLHLLGYEHEKGGQAEKEMFELQDKLFDVLRDKHL
jgi:probable rRNA maturation factor